MMIAAEKRGHVTVVSVEGSVDGTTAGELIASARLLSTVVTMLAVKRTG
jgi:hypothetical protein